MARKQKVARQTSTESSAVQVARKELVRHDSVSNVADVNVNIGQGSRAQSKNSGDDQWADQVENEEHSRMNTTAHDQTLPSSTMSQHPAREITTGQHPRGLEEYQDRRAKDPSFIPNRGRFFMHDARGLDSRHSTSSQKPRSSGGYGYKSSTAKKDTKPDAARWTHDLHEAINDAPIESKTYGRRARYTDSVATASTSASVVGTVHIRVRLPNMQEARLCNDATMSTYTVLTPHQSPLRRDKAVRIALPGSAPKSVAPSRRQSATVGQDTSTFTGHHSSRDGHNKSREPDGTNVIASAAQTVSESTAAVEKPAVNLPSRVVKLAEGLHISTAEQAARPVSGSIDSGVTRSESRLSSHDSLGYPSQAPTIHTSEAATPVSYGPDKSMFVPPMFPPLDVYGQPMFPPPNMYGAPLPYGPPPAMHPQMGMPIYSSVAFDVNALPYPGQGNGMVHYLGPEHAPPPPYTSPMEAPLYGMPAGCMPFEHGMMYMPAMYDPQQYYPPF